MPPQLSMQISESLERKMGLKHSEAPGTHPLQRVFVQTVRRGGGLENLIRNVGQESCITFTWIKPGTVELAHQNVSHCLSVLIHWTCQIAIPGEPHSSSCPCIVYRGVKGALGCLHPQRIPLTEPGTS